MRHPGLHILIGLGIMSLGLFLVVDSRPGLVALVGGPNDAADIGVGVFLLFGGGFFATRALLLARQRSALQAGQNVVARWQVSTAEWEAFRISDAARANLFHSLMNRFRLRTARPPMEGVAVIVGTTALVADHAIIPLNLKFSFVALGQLGDVSYVEGAPGCLEFFRYYVGKSSRRIETVRLPVAATALAQAALVVEHFAAAIPERARTFARSRFDLHYQAAAGDAVEAQVEQRSRSLGGLALVCLVFGAIGGWIWFTASPAYAHLVLTGSIILVVVGVALEILSRLRN